MTAKRIYSNVQSHENGSTVAISLLCPGCRQRGTFVPTPNVSDSRVSVPNERNQLEQVCIASRVCPNQACKTLVVALYRGYEVLASYPVSRLDFDATGVPADVVQAFEEALSCHANECWMAASMLIRKTIEQLCADRGATGGSLIDRIKSLRTKITLPEELFEAADHLRLLGNDAAHVEAKVYSQVGKNEVEAGIDLAKELIKSVYQYKSLLGRLQALKKSSP